MEFALLLPMVAALVVTVLQAGLIGAELVAVQHLAREVARTAATADDAAARALAVRAAGARDVRVRIAPPMRQRARGTIVTVDLEVRSRTLARVGLNWWLPARAAMAAEGP